MGISEKQLPWLPLHPQIWAEFLLLSLLLGFAPVGAHGSDHTLLLQSHISKIDHFWQETLSEVASEPLDAKVEPVKAYLPYFKYRVTFRSLGGVTVQGWLSKPAHLPAKQKRLPAIVTVPGYGGWQQGITLSECQRGYIVFQVYPRSQGESEKFWKIDGPDKLTWHISSPMNYYYRGAYVDVIKGIDYLLSRPDVDKSRIGLMGTSRAAVSFLLLQHWTPT